MCVCILCPHPQRMLRGLYRYIDFRNDLCVCTFFLFFFSIHQPPPCHAVPCHVVQCHVVPCVVVLCPLTSHPPTHPPLPLPLRHLYHVSCLPAFDEVPVESELPPVSFLVRPEPQVGRLPVLPQHGQGRGEDASRGMIQQLQQYLVRHGRYHF